MTMGSKISLWNKQKISLKIIGDQMKYLQPTPPTMRTSEEPQRDIVLSAVKQERN